VKRGLVLKELREHGWVVLLLWLGCALAFLVFLKRAERYGSPFVAFGYLAAVFGTLLSLAVTNRLVVREYGGRTQLFLETLPVTRARVMATKWLLGAVVTLFPIAAALVATAALGSGRVLLSARFMALLAVRSLSFVLWFYALSFVVGLLGRFRFVAWGLLFTGLFALESVTQFPMEQLPPLELVSSGIAFERLTLPMVDLLVTWLITALLLIGAFAMALAGEGSLSSLLARRMTRREKVVAAVAALVPVALLAFLDARKPKPAFHLESAIVVEHGGQNVGIARTAGLNEAASRALGRAIASDLFELKDYLGLTRLPPVYVLPDASLDGDIFLRAALPASDGVVVRGALGSITFEEEEFRAFVIGEVVGWYTRGRAYREEQRWFVDGFKQWWVAQHLPSFEERLRRRAAAGATRVTPDIHALRRWLTTREQLGDCLGNALAWRVVSVLERDVGPSTMRSLAREVWGSRPPDDARVLFEPPFDRVLRRKTGLSVPVLAERAATALAQDRAGLAARSDALHSWSADFETRPAGGRLSEIHYRLGSSGNEAPSYAVRYTTLQPWDGEIISTSLSRVDAVRDGVLPLTVERGTRMFAGVDVRDETLQCTIRIGARRWVVP
jgi:hypothetical protein